MRFSKVRIESIAIEEAPEAVTSVAIEDALVDTYARLGIPKGCIETLVGIKARRFWPEGFHHEAGAVAAAQAALVQTGREAFFRERVGVLISTSVSKAYLEPSVAALVHGDLGLGTTCLNFDVANACLGFFSAMRLVAQQIEAGQIQAALIVASESSRPVVTSTIEQLRQPTATMDDYKAALPTLTLGSGAVAMLLTHENISASRHRFTGAIERAATAFNRVCIGTNEWMRTDATTLLKEGVQLGLRAYREAQAAFGWTNENIACYACHQVGATHLATLSNTLEIDAQKAFPTYPEFGNMGAAALPFTLQKAADAQAFGPDDTVALMGIGSGLNCAMAEVKW